jgi:hypothetical protein
MEQLFQAYSYRVQARFGSVLNLVIKDFQVTITGPRLAPGLYDFWLYAQAVLLVGCIASILLSLVFWSWIWLVAGIALFVLHFLGGGIGAGCLWEMEKLIQFGQGKDGSSVTFDKSQVKDIKVGAGWARGSIAWIIAPYVPGINKMAKDMAVSFLAPDGVKPGDTVYALHFRSVDDANKFLDWLKTG